MSDLFGNHIVGFSTRWLIYCSILIYLQIIRNYRTGVKNLTLMFLTYQKMRRSLFFNFLIFYSKILITQGAKSLYLAKKKLEVTSPAIVVLDAFFG